MENQTVNLKKVIQRYFCRLTTAFVCGLLLCLTVYGLNRNRAITQFQHTAWTIKDGAPEQIRALAQTSDGYLWLGTATGLYRFDGIRFDSYVPQSGKSLLSNDIYALLATPDGGLWIGYFYGGVSFLKDGKLTNYGEAEGLPTGKIRNFAEDCEGVIWAATEGGLTRFDNARWQPVGPEQNYLEKKADTVFVDKEGTLWVSTGNTITFLPKGATSFHSTGEQTGQVEQMVKSADGALWIAEKSRAVRQLGLPGTKSRFLGPEIQVGSRSLLIDRDGALWATSIGDGIRRVPYTDLFRGQKIAQFSTDAEIFTEKDGLSGNYIFTVFEDREGNIWMGTANGLDRFRESTLVPVQFPPGELNFGMVAGNDGEVLIFSRSLWVIRRGDSVPVKIRADNDGEATFRDNEGTFWVNGHDVIFGLNEDGTTKIRLTPPIKNSKITQIFKDRRDRLWVYCEAGGLFHLADGIWEKYEKQSELPQFAPISGIIDSLNRIWFGYANNLLAIIDGDELRTFSEADGLQVGDIKSIYEHAGRVWIGGTRGLAVFEENRFRMLSADGVDELSGISGIIESRDDSLWLNSSRGIVHIPANEVRTARENPAYKFHYQVFDFLDGLPGAGQQNPPLPTAIEGSDGRLWFATTKGIAWLDPQNMIGNTAPPPVSIRSLSADDKLYEPISSLELPKGTTKLQFDFAALNLSVPERVRFRYKLEAVDNEWQEAGTRRQAFYNSLGPGNYRFRVIASINGEVWNEKGAIIEFSIAPMFYQTNWFRFLIVSLSSLLIVIVFRLFYRWRLARATERLKLGFDERLAERTRIAHELHDTLLQGFLGATIRLQAVSNLLPTKSETAKEALDNVLDQIDVVLEDGRRAIWDMHSTSASEDDLLELFTFTGEDLNNTYSTNFSLTIEGEKRLLHPLVRDQIHRIGREALTNAFCHARATKIELEIEYNLRQLRLVIRDNGCGINPDYLNAGRKGHLGLSGMREAAEKIGAELKIWSRIESGTEVELVVPQQIAFVKKSSGSLFKKLSRGLRRQNALNERTNDK